MDELESVNRIGQTVHTNGRKTKDAPITANLCSRSISCSRSGATPPPPPAAAPEPDEEEVSVAVEREADDGRLPPVSGRRPYSFLLGERWSLVIVELVWLG